MSPWIIWLIAACLLLALEVLSQAVWALCFAVGCLAAMLLSFITGSAALQALSVPLVAILTWIIFAPVVRKWESKRSKNSRTGMDALLGRRATVTEDIRPGELGRARIDGDSWQVSAPGAEATIRRGHEVVVTAYDSIILTVEPVSAP